MNAVVIAQLVLHGIVAVLAATLARQRPEHRAVSIFVGLTLLTDLAGWFIIYACPWINAPGPFTGIRRVIGHFDQALFLSWAIGVAAVSTAVYLRRKPWPVFVAAAAVLAVLVAGYPTIRGATLGAAYALIDGAVVAWSIFCAAVWTKRSERPRPWHASALLLFVMECANFFGPYAPPMPSPFDGWGAAQVTYLMIWTALLFLHGSALWGSFMLVDSPRDSARLLH